MAISVVALLLASLVLGRSVVAAFGKRRWAVASVILALIALPFASVFLLVGYSRAQLDVAGVQRDMRQSVGEIAGDVGEAIGEGFEGIEGIEDVGEAIGEMGDAVGRMGDRVGAIGDRFGNRVDEWIDGDARARPPTPPTPPRPPATVGDALADMDAAGVSVPQIDLGEDTGVDGEVDDTDADRPGNLFETLKTADLAAKGAERPAWVDNPPASDNDVTRGVVRSTPSPILESAETYARMMRVSWIRQELNDDLRWLATAKKSPALERWAERVVVDTYVEARQSSVGAVFIVHELLEYDREDERELVEELHVGAMDERRGTRSFGVATLGAAVMGLLGVVYAALKATQPRD